MNQTLQGLSPAVQVFVILIEVTFCIFEKLGGVCFLIKNVDTKVTFQNIERVEHRLWIFLVNLSYFFVDYV